MSLASTQLELLPIFIGLDGRPRLETGVVGQKILERMRVLSAVLGTELQVGRGMATVSIPMGGTALTAPGTPQLRRCVP